MLVNINAAKTVGDYLDPTRWQNNTLRYAPPGDFPAFLAGKLGRAKIMRSWITLDEFWDYKTDTYYENFEIGVLRHPIEELHYPYDWKVIVPAPSPFRVILCKHFAVGY